MYITVYITGVYVRQIYAKIWGQYGHVVYLHVQYSHVKYMAYMCNLGAQLFLHIHDINTWSRCCIWLEFIQLFSEWIGNPLASIGIGNWLIGNQSIGS